jgi:hypothetical protein
MGEGGQGKVGREISQYLSMEEFPKKRAPVTAFDRENGKGKWAGKRWEGNIHNREHILDYAQNWTQKYVRKLDTKYA